MSRRGAGSVWDGIPILSNKKVRLLIVARALILLNEFFDALETVADWCENTVDIVRAIAVRTR